MRYFPLNTSLKLAKTVIFSPFFFKVTSVICMLIRSQDFPSNSSNPPQKIILENETGRNVRKMGIFHMTHHFKQQRQSLIRQRRFHPRARSQQLCSRARSQQSCSRAASMVRIRALVA